MNILILSCGTRYKLVSYFKESKEFRKVIATDCSEHAPALYVADNYYIVPRMIEVGYFDCLIDICKKESINMVLPLQEDELLLIAANKQILYDIGVIPIVSDYEKVMLCKDKLRLNEFLIKQGVSAVPTVLAKEYLKEDFEKCDIYVKPRFGAGSVNTMSVHSRDLLEALIKESAEELIVQPLINGKEYGIDVYTDLMSGEMISCFCKQKLRMRAGETEKSISIKNIKIEELIRKAIAELKLVGPLDIDVMEQDGDYYILEINPRFGGGYPHAYACGISFPKYIACNGKRNSNFISQNVYSEGILAMKYSDIIIK